MRTHRTTRKALFVPDSRCPIPTERLENYRRTIVHRQNGNNEDFEHKYQDITKSQQKRALQGQTWTGETWFRVKRGTPLPGNTPPQRPALPSQATQLLGTAKTSTPAAKTQQPLTRHTIKNQLTIQYSNNKAHQQLHQFHIQRKSNQQLTIGSKKDTCGKEYMFSREWTCTFHNKQMMDLM